MKTYKILVITDHKKHSDQNSVYAIVRELAQHEQCEKLDVLTRGIDANKVFFDGDVSAGVRVTSADENFEFDVTGRQFLSSRSAFVSDYNIVVMRLPRPVTDEFLLSLSETFPDIYFVNDPNGIRLTSNKKFMLELSELCPAVRLCHSIKDILDFASKFDIVLKPLKEYGGKGILRVYGKKISDGTHVYNASDYLKSIEKTIIDDGFLAMKFLKNVDKGDKRLLVVDGQVVASSLRLPAKGSWLCNVSQGGTSVVSEPDQDEMTMVEKIRPIVQKYGVLMYGVDTLVDDSGKRVLSEINTMSIGGFMQAQEQTGIPVIDILINKIFYFANLKFND